MGKKYPINQPELGKSLYDLRMKRGLTQQELREKSHVSVRTIQRIESGAVTPRSVTIRILLDALDQNVEDWYGEASMVNESSPMNSFKNIFLVNVRELDLKNALAPAWIAGIVYLLMVIMESGLGLFTEYENPGDSLWISIAVVKVIAAISFLLFARGLLSLSLLFEIHLLKIASYLSMVFVTIMYLSEAILMIANQSYTGFVETFRALSIMPLGAISIFLGIGLVRLQDGMGKIAKVAGRLELIFGISYSSLILSFIGVILLLPLLIVEIVLLSKADQLVKDGEL